MKTILLISAFLSGLFLAITPAKAQDDGSHPDDLMLLEQQAQIQAIENLLATTKVSIDVTDIPLDNLVELIHDLTGINIVVSPKTYEKKKPEEYLITFAVTDIPLSDLLSFILDQLDLKARILSGIIILEPAKSAEEEEKILLVYYVLDMMFEVQDFPGPNVSLTNAEDTDIFGVEEEEEDKGLNPEKLAEMIKEATGGDDVWSKEGMSMSYVNGLLFIRADKETHKRVLEFLALLRAAK